MLETREPVVGSIVRVADGIGQHDFLALVVDPKRWEKYLIDLKNSTLNRTLASYRGTSKKTKSETFCLRPLDLVVGKLVVWDNFTEEVVRFSFTFKYNCSLICPAFDLSALENLIHNIRVFSKFTGIVGKTDTLLFNLETLAYYLSGKGRWDPKSENLNWSQKQLLGVFEALLPLSEESVSAAG